NISSANIVDYMGWISAKVDSTSNSPVHNIILNGTATPKVLTTSNAVYTQFAHSTTYPPGNTDIGIDAEYTTTPHTTTLNEAGIIVAYIVPSSTVIGDGTDGGNSTIGPGAAATEIDRFSLSTSSGTDTVTGLTVTLGPTGAFNNIATVDIQTGGGVSKCSATPSSNTVLLTSCAIGVTTTPTDYAIIITPKSHAVMPAVPGASYATTATVTSITATNATTGTDTDSATITVDNASPAGVTSSTASSGSTVVDLAWTNPADSDFTTSGTVVVLRRTTSVVTDVPVEGTTYSVGNTIGSSTVACVLAGSPPAVTCQDTSLSNGTPYYYKIFTKDSRGNYDAGTVPTGSPVTPAVTVTISGTVYDDESGNSPWPGCGANTNIAISVNGGTKTNVVCNTATGVFTVNKTVSSNNIVTIFMDTAGADKGVTYTRAVDSATNITGLSLVKNTAWLRYETGSSITNANISTYDKTNDSDIPVNVTGSNLVGDSGVEIHVDDSKTFAPGGDVSVDNIHVKGTYTGGSGETTTLGNGLKIDSGATFTAPTNLALSGNLINDGTFTSGSRTVTINPGVSEFQYYRAITVDHTKVSASNQVNFPVLVSGTYSYLATTQNGGKVLNASGYDVGFYTNSNCSSGKMPWETETYTASSGLVNYWVRVPVLSSSTDTVFYMCYGNSNISSDQSNAPATWDPGYKLVSHLPNGSTLSAVDSTYFGNNGTITGTTAVTGKIGGASSTNGTDQNVNYGSNASIDGFTTKTISFWLKRNSVPGSSTDYALLTKGLNTAGWALRLRRGSDATNGHKIFYDENWTASTFGQAIYYGTTKLNSTTPWYYIVVTMNNSTAGNAPTIYLDGVAESLTAPQPTLGTVQSDSPNDFKFGENQTGGIDANEQFDEVRYSNVIRSAGWITTEYNNQNSPSTFYAVGSESVNGSTTIIGGASNIAFHDFTVTPSNGGSKFLKFKNGNSYTFNGTFSVAGQTGSFLELSSTTSGSSWTATFNSTANVAYVRLKDSACAGGNNISPSATIIDLGNNGSCWKFISKGGGGGGVEASANPDGQVGGGGVGGGGGGDGGVPSGAGGTVVLSNGLVESVSITSGGTNYATPPSVSFCGGGGSGAAGTAVVSSGAVTNVNITSGGSNYSTPPTIVFNGSCGGGAGGGGGDSGFLDGKSNLASVYQSGFPIVNPLQYLVSFLLWW
ncbi:MAG: hypothetical protein KBC06_01495, partial [Candidatus Pacebacteria bacterium]|nr:hypothetical protein [Candidatus Paceibacterota bacterium]